MTERPNEETLVVGSGPAGISTVLWLRDLELPFRWITSDRSIGGTLQRVSNPISNFAGIDVAQGRQLIPHFASQLEKHGLEPEFDARLAHLAPLNTREDAHGTLRVSIERDGERGETDFACVVLATGTRPRTLTLANEPDRRGEGIELSVSGARSHYQGLPTVIVGGGDAALEGALLLAELCPRVYLVHRSREFRAQQRFIDSVRDHDGIELILEDEVEDVIRGSDNELVGVLLTSGKRLQARGLFERIGVEPATPNGLGSEVLCEHGYVDTDRHGRTSIRGLYAVGDVADRDHQSVAWAVGSGAHVATAIQRDLGRRAAYASGDA